MPIQVRIPTVMRSNTAGKSVVDCSGSTIGQVLDDLVSQHKDIAWVLYDGQGNLHKYVNIYLESDDIRYIGGLDAETGESKEITILPAVAGGDH